MILGIYIFIFLFFIYFKKINKIPRRYRNLAKYVYTLSLPKVQPS